MYPTYVLDGNHNYQTVIPSGSTITSNQTVIPSGSTITCSCFTTGRVVREIMQFRHEENQVETVFVKFNDNLTIKKPRIGIPFGMKNYRVLIERDTASSG